MHIRPSPSRAATIGALALTFVLSVTIRVWGISTHFWLLEDQMRDRRFALGPFSELPLVGPPTHVGGYTIGPAFYWILWAVRVTIGPFFDNLPHAGGIGQAILQSGADALLLSAVWHRTGSPWIALATIVLLVTSAYDLCLAPLVWNPVMGSTLAKAATALVLLDWHRQSLVRAAITAALAWTAVHAYTGAIYVAVSVFLALLLDPLIRGDRALMRRNLVMIAVVVVLLQLPYVAHQVLNRFGDQAMGAVSGSVGRILSGEAVPEVAKSVNGLVGAVSFIQFAPWTVPFFGWALLACSVVVGVRYRRDPSLLAMTLLPPAMSVAGYSLFLASLDHYYYLSLMPAAVMTLVLALSAMSPPRLAPAVGVVMVLGALAMVPTKVRFSATMHRMPQYGVLVDASRQIERVGQPMRSIRTEFALPPTTDPEYLFKVLGGRIDPASPWTSAIATDGRVIYRKVEEP